MEGKNGKTSFWWTAKNISIVLGHWLCILSSMQKWAEKNGLEEVDNNLESIISEIDSLSESLYDLSEDNS